MSIDKDGDVSSERDGVDFLGATTNGVAAQRRGGATVRLQYREGLDPSQ